MASFKIKTKDFLEILKRIKVAVGRRSPRSIATTCEITVKDGEVTLAVPGAIFSMLCETTGTCKISFSFLHFAEIIKDLKLPELEIKISEGEMKIHNVTILVKTTFFENDRILRTIQLPLNYTDGDLLRLTKEGYTWEELNFNKLTFKISQAEENLEKNKSSAFRLLKPYGVSFDDIEDLLKKRMNIN